MKWHKGNQDENWPCEVGQQDLKPGAGHMYLPAAEAGSTQGSKLTLIGGRF